MQRTTDEAPKKRFLIIVLIVKKVKMVRKLTELLQSMGSIGVSVCPARQVVP